jgi:hypothetical protein
LADEITRKRAIPGDLLNTKYSCQSPAKALPKRRRIAGWQFMRPHFHDIDRRCDQAVNFCSNGICQFLALALTINEHLK